MGPKNRGADLDILDSPLGKLIRITYADGETSTFIKREGSKSIERVSDE